MSRASPARAGSYIKASSEHEDCWEKEAFVLCSLCIFNGWARYADEFWSPAPSKHVPVADVDAGVAAEAAAAAAPVEPDGASVPVHGAPGPSDRWASKYIQGAARIRPIRSGIAVAYGPYYSALNSLWSRAFTVYCSMCLCCTAAGGATANLQQCPCCLILMNRLVSCTNVLAVANNDKGDEKTQSVAILAQAILAQGSSDSSTFAPTVSPRACALPCITMARPADKRKIVASR